MLMSLGLFQMKPGFFCTCSVILALSLGTSDRAAGQGPKDRAATYRGGLVTPPLPKPRFTLSTTSGDTFDFRLKTDGYVTLLFFGYTNCPDVCPLHMSNIGTALRNMPSNLADQVKLVFVTTDPARDSGRVLRSWLDHFDKRFIGLTGTDAAIAAAQLAAGLPPAKKTTLANGNYGVAHSSVVLVYSKDNLAHLIYPDGMSQQDWAHDLPQLVKENGWSKQ
jgi:protein SCO1